jgi:hypothetical protein
VGNDATPHPSFFFLFCPFYTRAHLTDDFAFAIHVFGLGIQNLVWDEVER